jgi:hypothetical protein
MKSLFLICCILIISKAFSQDTTSVLFIGNSFTFYNDMPFIFKDIAISKGKNVFVDTVVEGGKDFKFHSKQDITYQTIKARKWDYIILQGHSNEFAQPDVKVDTLTFPYVKQIIDSIRKHNSCTRVNLYMTWGYKNGNPKWKAIATYDSMQEKIEMQYLRFTDKLNTGVNPVGAVWREVRTSNPEINLYQEDLFHPNLAGSYLSACTHFTTIFGETPFNNNIKINLDNHHKQVIELAATKIVLNQLGRWRYIPMDNKLQTGFDIIQKNDVIRLVNNAINQKSVSWDLGDGTSIDSENKICHVYEKKGEYIIKQIITNHCKSASLERKIVID